MIEKMKVVHIVTTTAHKEEMLSQVRSLGLVHLSEKKSADRETTERFNTLSRTEMALKELTTGKEQLKRCASDEEFETLYGQVLAAIEKKKELQQTRNAAVTEADRIRGWGDFSPAAVQELKGLGYDLHFYRLGNKEYEQAKADENIKLIKLASVEKMDAVAVFGTLPESIPANEFRLPEKSVTELEQQVKDCDAESAKCDEVLKDAGIYLPSFGDAMLKAQNVEEFSAADRTAETDGDFVWLSGYIPADDMEAFRKAAEAGKWAWAAEDPAEDDEKVPTKVHYTKLTRIMKPVFDILGTLPGYREFDISFWFLLFFTLFFAMIVGDAAYGCIFLLATIYFHKKYKKVNDAILLGYVMSAATIIWGSVTGTWFGLESAMKVPFLKALVYPGFANYPEYFGVTASQQQNNIMKFCFIIGAIHISLACIMNIRKKVKIKDLSWVADFGWLCAVCSLYFLVLYLVIGEQVNLKPIAVIVIMSFFLVVIFGGMSPDKSFADGLKAGLGDSFTVFLNTISCFGNVMSYIRLFAVGMASLAIAQSFNSMAAGFKGPLIVIGAVIAIAGHVLNIGMALLSVVVHGVRLNLLEFSGQLGMEWTGIAYEPFKKLDKIKK